MSAQPFVKWAGGKRRQVDDICRVLPAVVQGVYIEPFLGGGAVFFELARRRAFRGHVVLSDSNFELINLWRWVQADPAAVLAHARRWANNEDVYYWVRSWEHTDDALGAARTLWLNRTCFNGLYRLNQTSRHFNVPWGKGSGPVPIDDGNVYSVARLLERVAPTLMVADWSTPVSAAGEGDVIYCDPPYWPVTRDSFINYDGCPFTPRHHVELIDGLQAAGRRGAAWALSNSGADDAWKLYDGRDLTVREVYARRAINRDSGGRGPVCELLVTP